MAFPQVIDADTKNGVVTSNSTSWTLTYPTNLVSGDLILAFVSADGNGAASSTGWIYAGFVTGLAVRLTVLKKVSAGTETGNFTATISANEQGAWRVFRITGWEGTLGTNFSSDPGAVEAVFSNLTSPSLNPDPANLNPTNWDVEDTLWFAAIAVDASRTISVYPLAGRNTATISGGSGGATLGLCSTESAVASLDPGTFTISLSDSWVAGTVAVRPVAAVAAEPGAASVQLGATGVSMFGPWAGD